MTFSTVLTRALLAGTALTATLALSACGDNDDPAPGRNHDSGVSATSGPSAQAGAQANDADVAFAQMMIPHHRQAVDMAALADGRAASHEVAALAIKIKRAQQPEIDTMTKWLAVWGKPTTMPGGMGHRPMPGVMSAAELTKLNTATGAAFDKQFLTMMIAHHQGAVTMAQDEGKRGSNRDAKALATKIIADQQAEIAQMRTLLAKL